MENSLCLFIISVLYYYGLCKILWQETYHISWDIEETEEEFLDGMGRSQSMVLIFLEDLKEVPPFPMWIRSAIFNVIKDGRKLIKTHCTCPCHQHY
jgi:hypothetical protein